MKLQLFAKTKTMFRVTHFDKPRPVAGVCLNTYVFKVASLATPCLTLGLASVPHPVKVPFLLFLTALVAIHCAVLS